MKYNKQLFDHIQVEYNKLLSLGEFIYDNLIEKNEELSRYEVMLNFDLYTQGILAKIILDTNPKNPALFNMLRKLHKYGDFYQGVGLDDWFSDKTKTLNNIKKKIKQVTSTTPVIIQIITNIDAKTKKTEFSYQLLEAFISMVMLLTPDKETYEEVEKDIINKYFADIYESIQKKLKKV